jgi:hypothetical protein
MSAAGEHGFGGRSLDGHGLSERSLDEHSLGEHGFGGRSLDGHSGDDLVGVGV